jgi:hypothetical protein
MPPKPVLECFATLEDYIEAMIEWNFQVRYERDREWLRRLGVASE